MYKEELSKMSSLPQVACIIVNWNGWRDTVACLDALQHGTYPNLTMIVVDNDSTDNSVSQIRAAHSDIELLQNEKNLGFAGGNNTGIRYAIAHGAEYCWLLNNDTEPAPDALSALVAKAVSNKRIGAVASVCYYFDKPQVVQAWAGARANLWIGYARNTVTPHRDEWFHAIYGASMLLCRAALEDVGLLDERFFLYWEETEFCFRLRKKGWQLAAAADSRVLHKVNASTGGNKLILDRYFTASGLRILQLHSPAPVLAMPIFLAMRFARRLLSFQFSRCRSVWLGVLDYVKDVMVS